MLLNGRLRTAAFNSGSTCHLNDDSTGQKGPILSSQYSPAQHNRHKKCPWNENMISYYLTFSQQSSSNKSIEARHRANCDTSRVVRVVLGTWLPWLRTSSVGQKWVLLSPLPTPRKMSLELLIGRGDASPNFKPLSGLANLFAHVYHGPCLPRDMTCG